MTCRELVRSILEFEEGDLTAGDRRLFLRHLAACADCARYLESYRAAVALEREVPGEPDAELPEELVLSILAARERADARPIFPAIALPGSHFWNMAAGVAASQILFFYFGS